MPELRSIQLQDSGTLVVGAAVTLARLADTLEEVGKKVQVSAGGVATRLLGWGDLLLMLPPPSVWYDICCP